jgi:hypothetical protein
VSCKPAGYQVLYPTRSRVPGKICRVGSGTGYKKKFGRGTNMIAYPDPDWWRHNISKILIFNYYEYRENWVKMNLMMIQWFINYRSTWENRVSLNTFYVFDKIKVWKIFHIFKSICRVRVLLCRFGSGPGFKKRAGSVSGAKTCTRAAL